MPTPDRRDALAGQDRERLGAVLRVLTPDDDQRTRIADALSRALPAGGSRTTMGRSVRIGAALVVALVFGLAVVGSIAAGAAPGEPLFAARQSIERAQAALQPLTDALCDTIDRILPGDSCDEETKPPAGRGTESAPGSMRPGEMTLPGAGELGVPASPESGNRKGQTGDDGFASPGKGGERRQPDRPETAPGQNGRDDGVDEDEDGQDSSRRPAAGPRSS